MVALARIGVLVEMRPVEEAEPVRIGREVARDPIEQHADAGTVEGIDQRPELVCAAEPAGRCEQPDRLIAPGTVERELADRQELDMGEAHVPDIGDQGVRELRIGEIAVAVLGLATPGAEMNLIDRDRRRRPVGPGSGLHPLPIAPAMLGWAGDDGGCLRRSLRLEGERIGLERQRRARGRLDLVFVARARLDAGHEDLPDAAFVSPPHGVAAPVPAVEIADHADRARIRRPDRECHAPGLCDALHMGAESMPSLQVVAFGEKMDVEVAEDRRKRIGIVEIVRLVAPSHPQAV
jgi:hypothetical protein